MEAHANDLTSMALVTTVAVLCGLLFTRIRQPAIVGYILAGVVLGPTGFRLVQNSENVTSLAELGKLFASAENLLLAGWIHYLAFDLFIGAWVLRDAQRLGIGHGLTVPCLLLTLAFGPIGLLTYFGVRLSRTKSLALGGQTA